MKRVNFGEFYTLIQIFVVVIHIPHAFIQFRDSIYPIDTAREYIRNNYRDTITLNDVSSYVFLNPNYFSTLFKSKTGTTFLQYLRDFCIQTSKELRAFKEVEGISPTEYKNSL